jgi:hypothetical protein
MLMSKQLRKEGTKKCNQNAFNQSGVISCFEMDGHIHSIAKRVNGAVIDFRLDSS